MPTPVSIARQCLAEEAAAALDDAVAVAKRRSHAQTTSLHAISALLALPSSSLREACTRARSSAYSPRLQFRALELCVGVALDKISASKSNGEDPPVSNSLMAAIKRSQANQRRHPETFHLYQQQLNSNSSSQPSISVVKVELKHFVVSILDDPIVSRVFGDAGFRTHDLKLAIINPLTMSRFSTMTRCPPLFLSSLSDLELNKRGPNFPFYEAPTENVDENSKRIGEILVQKNKRNPLLSGVCANDALRNFTDGVKRAETGFLPKAIDGLSFISIDHDLSEFINEDLSEEMMGLKFKEVGVTSENCQGPGIIVNFGNLKAFVDVESVDVVNYVVSQLKRLLDGSSGKLWLIGFLAGDDDYKKLLGRFPSIETDLDLQVLPITSSKPSAIGGKYFKSSLMGSFVPFGGFFSMPSEQETLGPKAIQSLSLCNLCKEKYEQEVSILKGTSTDSVAKEHTANLSSWLRMTECETGKRSSPVEAKDDKTVLDVRVMALQRKWSDICQRLHHTGTSQENIPQAKAQTFSIPSFNNVPTWKDSMQVGSISNGTKVTDLSPCMPSDPLKQSSPKPKTSKPIVLGTGANVQGERPVEMNDLQNPSCSQRQMSLPIAHTSSSSIISVTTDLGLGTIYPSAGEGRKKPNLQEHYPGMHSFSESSRIHENTPRQVAQPTLCSHGQEKQMYKKNFESPWNVLAQKICWQIEAIQSICRIVSCCRNGDVRYKSSNKGNLWLSFLGPDKVGKRKIAAALAEIVFGRREHFLTMDLNSQDGVSPSSSIFDSYESIFRSMKSGRKMIVDCLAEELSKRPHSVVLLENIEKADFLVQSSLSQAVKTGKFPDSHARDININNIIFIISSSILKTGEDLCGLVSSEFSEDKILEARNLQMQILIRSIDGNFSNSTTSVSVTPSNGKCNQSSTSKRKLTTHEPTNSEMAKRTCQVSRSIIDLNLPVEDTEEDIDILITDDDTDNSKNSEVWLEELLEHVDEKVIFKPFDFDSLAQKILKEIGVGLQRVGVNILLEIDREVMAQILAATWLTDKKNAVEDWIEQVLCSTIKEARQRGNSTSDFVMKLVACDGLVVEKQASGLCLPARIKLN